ncbi:keratinocyte-associated protein 2 [Frankliniella occidentalis]|uniref:Keratinocyte-associated protein 2 n=1 Tax=Frankliniella occidentalis TaxID=133901 RepID=A0A6J1RV73_FRAOC|nr:keratinocyte-associated protein 2 [Frankliniella occidentalis]
MAVSTGASFVLSLLLSVVVFSGMQMYKSWFTSTQLHTVFGGYISSVLFLLILTSIGNLESIMFGKHFQVKLFPEIFICFIMALTAAGSVHRVCVTTGFAFSCLGLYFVNGISQKTYGTTNVQTAPAKKRK